MSKKSIIIVVVAVLVVLGLVVLFGLNYFMSRGPKLADVEFLKEPRITERANEKVIALTLTGEPSKIAGSAISDLYKIYYRLKVDKNQTVAPKARWEDFSADKNNLKGEFAMIVPMTVTEVPQGGKVELKEWQYGTVAEILHIGSYDSETSTIEKLKKYITDQGYEISGPHEEEYLKVPGFLSKGKPEDTLTVIRYQVKKK